MGGILALRKRILPPRALNVVQPKEPPTFPHIETDADFKKKLLQHKARLIVIDFYATWCLPCKKMHPQLIALARRYPRVVFFIVNIDSAPDIADQFDVMTIPTFLFFREQEVVDAYSGSSVEEVEARLAVLSRSDYKLHLSFIKEDNADIADFYKGNFLDMLIMDVKKKEEAVAGTPGKPLVISDPKDIVSVVSSSEDLQKTVDVSSEKPGPSVPSTAKPGPPKNFVRKVRTTGRSAGNAPKPPVTHSGNSVRPSTRQSVKHSNRARGKQPPAKPLANTPVAPGKTNGSPGIIATGNIGISTTKKAQTANRSPGKVATGSLTTGNEIHDWVELHKRKWYRFMETSDQSERERIRRQKQERKERDRQIKKEKEENERIERLTREKRAKQEMQKKEKEQRERKEKERERKEKERVEKKENDEREKKEKEAQEKKKRE